MFNLSIEYEANLDIIRDYENTPLKLACYLSHIKIAKSLLDSNINVNRINIWHNGGGCLYDYK